MHLSIVGSGYVGTTAAACLAAAGHQVTAIDVDQAVVDAINDGEAPIHEPGLADLVATHGGDRLTATTDHSAIRDTKVTLVAVPTPSTPDGSIDTSILEAALTDVGSALESTVESHVVAIKSTVVPSVIEETVRPLLADSGATLGEDLHVATNPEFLREGSAVSDFQDPDKIVIGADSAFAADRIAALYEPIIETADPAVIRTEPHTAMMIKYANNAFLASKVSLINDIGNICKEHEIDAYTIADALGQDHRISEHFLRSGLGWGGSCFGKDVAAISAAAREHDYEPAMLDAAVEVNDHQPTRMLELMDRHTDVAGDRVAVLGLSFKPGTDDIRDTRAVPVIEGLRARDASIAAYDPAAIENMRERFPDLEYTADPEAALEDSVAALIVTDWEEIAALDGAFDRMRTPVVIDGRRAIDRRDGIVYEGLTW